MDIIQTLALTMGVAWASGINLYAAIAMLGILGVTGQVELPPDLAPLSHPLVIASATLMYCIEFFADKVPGMDSAWDSVHTFIRIPAGAVLAAGAVGAVGDVSVPAQLAAALLGGGLSAATHATKAGSRVMINTSPEPLSNWTLSLGEDVAVIGGLWVALHYPGVFIGLLVVFILAMVWLAPKLWRGIRVVFSRFPHWFGLSESRPAPPPGPPAV